MFIGFIIWSAVFLVLLGIGILAWRSEKPVGFFSGVKPPEVTDIRRYNHAVAVLWFGYAGLFELIGLPFLFTERNPAWFLWMIPGTVVISIGLTIVYSRILRRYERKK